MYVRRLVSPTQPRNAVATAQLLYKKTRFLANHSAVCVFNPDHQTTEFRQTTVKTTVADPAHYTLTPQPLILNPESTYL
jgi:hypothetical protein